MSSRSMLVVTLALAVGLLCPATAHAYLDPGSGSLLLQGLIAGLLGALMAIRIYFAKIKLFVKRLLGRETRP